jgi:2-polyprenyl-3-methyl-5-hydroxy-6-metoxy-1,4-benzoquinol methylase
MLSTSLTRPHLDKLRCPAIAQQTNFVALSGVACSGKSTTGNALVEAGFCRMPETMRLWMDGVKAQGGDIKALKSAGLLEFRRDLFEVAQSIVEHQALFDPTQPMVFNRPGIDALMFMRADGVDYGAELERMRKGPRFRAVCVFEPLPLVEDGTRVNDPTLRERQEKALREVIAELGYTREEVIEVPVMGRTERANYVLAELTRRGVIPKRSNVDDQWAKNKGHFLLRLDPTSGEIDLSKSGFEVSANVLVAWPAIHKTIADESERRGRSLHVIDFGCGTGAMAQQIARSGHLVIGCDCSAEMIHAARSNNPYDVPFVLGGLERLSAFPRHDLLCAALVTNYLGNLDDFAQRAAQAVPPEGVVTFVDLNPAYVKRCLELGIIYSNADSLTSPRHATLSHGDGDQRLTLWTSDEYHRAMAGAGLRVELEQQLPNSTRLLTEHGKKIKPGYPLEIPRYRHFIFRKHSM